MTTTQSKNQLAEPLSTEAELAKLSEQTPESKKPEIIGKTREKVGRFAGVFGLAATLTAGTPAMATESPYEPLADVSGKTVLVLKEEGKGKEELFAAFEKNGKTEKFGGAFNKLSIENQKKVLSFYIQAKLDQKDERTLLKGVYNLSLYYNNIKINEDALMIYRKTGKLPDVELPAIWSSALMVTQSSSSGLQYVNVEKAKEIDELIIKIERKEVVEGKKEVVEGKKEVVEIKKSILLMQQLLKAL